MRHILMALPFIALSGLGAFGSSARADTLYDDLGARAGIEAIVDNLLTLWARDPRIAHSLHEANLPRLEEKLVLQICELSGGPCVYDGLSMADSHAGHDISPAEFNALVEVLRQAMKKEGVAYADQNRLLALLAPMRRDVVTPPGQRAAR